MSSFCRSACCKSDRVKKHTRIESKGTKPSFSRSRSRAKCSIKTDVFFPIPVDRSIACFPFASYPICHLFPIHFALLLAPETPGHTGFSNAVVIRSKDKNASLRGLVKWWLNAFCSRPEGFSCSCSELKVRCQLTRLFQSRRAII